MYCPNCSKPVPEGVRFCSYCGKPVAEAPARPPQPPAAAPPAAPNYPPYQPAQPPRPAPQPQQVYAPAQPSPAYAPPQPQMAVPQVRGGYPQQAMAPAQPGQGYCHSCGAVLQPGAAFCLSCGRQVVGPVAGAFEYAGFWLRVVANLIDSVAISIGLLVVGIVLGIFLAASGMSSGELDFLARMLGFLISTPAVWTYFALCESSPWQATLGKKALGLKVTDLEGGRISFGRATGRHFAKYISLIILGMGFVMAGFTAKKQALHDQLAGCLVVKIS